MGIIGHYNEIQVRNDIVGIDCEDDIIDWQLGQLDFYNKHNKYGEIFKEIISELHRFLYQYSNVPQFLFTVAPGSNPVNRPFKDLISSNDEDEQSAWVNERTDKETKTVYDSFEIIHNPIKELELEESLRANTSILKGGVVSKKHLLKNTKKY